LGDYRRHGILLRQQANKENDMKTFLVVAAVLGLSSSAALADCAGHKVTASKVDKTFTTASIAATPQPEELKQVSQPADRAEQGQKATQ
jgi:hypothetical protein